MAFKHLSNLKQRAQIIAKIREFFASRKILEVETPLLCSSTNPAPHLDSFCCEQHYLQTSPEFAMKRLLAAGSGDIYQICKAFRAGEAGRIHNPEFTILEWYRVGWDHQQLMDEVDAFLQFVLETPVATRITYEELFLKYLNINPHTCSVVELQNCANQHKINLPQLDAPDDYLSLLMTHLIEPKIGKKNPVFVYDFPASQAMLAKVRPDKSPIYSQQSGISTRRQGASAGSVFVSYMTQASDAANNAENLSAKSIASRFEIYYKGLELANGFHELNDAREQRQRFIADNQKRRELNKQEIPLDEKFLAGLPQMPPCAGVAVGVDRLIMLATKAKAIKDVISFTFENA